MKTNPLVSIIAPIYNVERYLPRCVDSLLCQTYSNLEIILVDDGSPDSCGQICEEYASRDNRVKVVHKENGGVSSARNMGLAVASGDWVAFVDADDWLPVNGVALLIEDANEGVALVMGGYLYAYDYGSVCPCADIEKRESFFSAEAMMEMFRPSDYPYHGYVFGKLFKTSWIRNRKICFDEDIAFNEDRLFMVNYLSCISGRVSYFTAPVYNYYQRDDSVMNSIRGGVQPKVYY